MSKKVKYNWKWVHAQIDIIGEKLEKSDKPEYVTGIPRGGLIPAVIISHRFEIPYIPLELAKIMPGNIKNKILVIDDIADSGNTLSLLQGHGFLTATLAKRHNSSYTPTYVGEDVQDDHWLVFPWESNNSKQIQDYLGE